VARWLTSAGLLALLAAGCGQASDRPAATHSTPQAASPQLVPVSKAPFRVKGSGFVPNERVRVELVGMTSRNVTASDSGSFEVTFSGIGQCSSVTGKAVGSKGSRASFNFSQAACMPP
jgi:hypothetical protein